MVPILTFCMLLLAWSGDRLQVDPNLPTYERVSGMQGNISSMGSDTLNNLVTLWAEGFRKKYPNVNLQVEGKGSSTAPPALAQGNAQLGPMSRPMKAEEIEAFEAEMGYPPTAIGVALDALAIFVNRDNPLVSLSLPEVDAIFSKTRKGGFPRDIRVWDQIVGDSAISPYPIRIYGRNSASGTYGYFKVNALFKGDFKDRVKEQPGSSSVVMSVTVDKAGIGYSGIGYQTSGVRVLRLSEEQGEPGYEPSSENLLSRNYPLGRMLYIYVNKHPTRSLSPAVEQFMRFALSKEGQEIVIKSGYIPLPAPAVERQLSLLTQGAGQ